MHKISIRWTKFRCPPLPEKAATLVVCWYTRGLVYPLHLDKWRTSLPIRLRHNFTFIRALLFSDQLICLILVELLFILHSYECEYELDDRFRVSHLIRRLLGQRWVMYDENHIAYEQVNSASSLSGKTEMWKDLNSPTHMMRSHNYIRI